MRGDHAGSCPFAPRAQGLPLLANTLDFLLSPKTFLTSLRERHGDIARIRVGWIDFTVILGAAAQEFLRAGGERHLERMSFFGPVGEQLGNRDFVLGLSGADHLRVRRSLAIAYSREVASRHVPEFLRAVHEHTVDWRAGETHDVMKNVTVMAFDQYSRAMCGRSLKSWWPDVRRVVTTSMNVGGRTWPQWAFRDPRYQRSRRKVLGLTKELVEERRRSQRDQEEPADILDALLSVKGADGTGLCQDEVHCYALYGFAGAGAYMNRAVGFLLYELLRDRDLYDRIEREVDDAFADQIFDAADMPRMPLLLAAWAEALRYHPVSQGLPYLAREDFTYGGYRVPRGSFVVLSQVPMHFDRSRWSEPERFDPARCMAPRNEHRDGGWAPYGMGHRTCSAAGLVELMALSMVAGLMREFRLEVAPSDYTLRTITMPLPGPVGRFGLKLVSRRSAHGRRVDTRGAWEARATASFHAAGGAAVQEVIARAEAVRYEPGAVITREGDASDAFFVLVEGAVDVSRRGRDGAERVVAVLTPGQYFGEAGLLRDAPRTATVRASAQSGATALRIDREGFYDLVGSSDLVSDEIARVSRRHWYSSAIQASLPSLDRATLAALLPEFEPTHHEPGDVIVRQGDVADRFYVIERGRVVVTRAAPDGTTRELTTLGPGSYFGEIGLLRRLPRNATVTALDPLDLLAIGREDFERFLLAHGGVRSDLALTMARRLRLTNTNR